MSWNLYHTTTWSGGPISAVGAGLTLSDGWIDNTGSKYSINASNQLTVVANTSFAEFLRPTAEDTQDQRIVWTINASLAGASNELVIYLRRQSTDDYYIFEFDPNNFSGQIGVSAKVSGTTGPPSGTVTATTGTVSGNNVHFATAYNSAHTYTFDCSAQGTGTTTLACTVTDTTASSVVCAFTVPDTGSTLQNATGRPGIAINSGASSPAIGGSIQLYNAAAAATLFRRMMELDSATGRRGQW